MAQDRRKFTAISNRAFCQSSGDRVGGDSNIGKRAFEGVGKDRAAMSNPLYAEIDRLKAELKKSQEEVVELREKVRELESERSDYGIC